MEAAAEPRSDLRSIQACPGTRPPARGKEGPQVISPTACLINLLYRRSSTPQPADRQADQRDGGPVVLIETDAPQPLGCLPASRPADCPVNVLSAAVGRAETRRRLLIRPGREIGFHAAG